MTLTCLPDLPPLPPQTGTINTSRSGKVLDEVSSEALRTAVAGEMWWGEAGRMRLCGRAGLKLLELRRPKGRAWERLASAGSAQVRRPYEWLSGSEGCPRGRHRLMGTPSPHRAPPLSDSRPGPCARLVPRWRDMG